MVNVVIFCTSSYMYNQYLRFLCTRDTQPRNGVKILRSSHTSRRRVHYDVIYSIPSPHDGAHAHLLRRFTVYVMVCSV